ncbi:MAG: DUF445 family protein [Spirochaetota bacterium]
MNKSLVTNMISVGIIVLGYLTPLYGSIIRIVGFFALSGSLTNWLAVHMLFEKVPLLYGSGVVPNHFEDFKRGIRVLIMEQFFTEEHMKKFLDETFTDSSKVGVDAEVIADAIDYDQAFSSLASVIMESSFGGMLGMIGGEAALQGFRKPFEEKMRAFIHSEVSQDRFQQAVTSSMKGEGENLVGSVSQHVETIVTARLEELTPKQVKEIVQEMIAKHLGWLVVWGGVFGGFIGFIMGLFQQL